MSHLMSDSLPTLLRPLECPYRTQGDLRAEMHATQQPVAIVTGAGRGLGRGVALALAARGTSLMLAARTERDLRSALAECIRSNASGDYAVTDVSVLDDVRTLVERTVHRFGRLDIVVNSAGVLGAVGSIGQVDPITWRDAIAVNLFGPVNVCHYAIPYLRSSSGVVINISGGGAAGTRPHLSAYACSKAALVRFTEILADEVRPADVRVYAVAPGPLDTRLHAELLASGLDGIEEYDRITRSLAAINTSSALDRAISLILYLIDEIEGHLSGKLISAAHDDWDSWDEVKRRLLRDSSWYSLRRMDPATVHSLKRTI